MTADLTPLDKLQRWYLSRCDGDWEHCLGVKIETLDNPGWHIRINLKGSQSESSTVNWVKIDRTESDWMHYRVNNKEFYSACGPLNLSEAIETFLEWFEAVRNQGSA
jgi:hypothetical protein